MVQVAIIRPGPIVGQMVNPFLQRRQGSEEVTYPHPSLEPVLERTLGVPLFQEQLLRIAMIAANFTGGEAEDLRRAMGFKRSQARMHEIEAKLRAGMTQNGISPKAQEEIILSITSFALYGFPESHAASFALIAYASAYLKCHYLAAFTAALLNNQPMGFYSPATIVKDAQRHGLKILPVDVMKSEWNCTWNIELTQTQKPSTPTRASEGRRSRLGLRYVRRPAREKPLRLWCANVLVLHLLPFTILLAAFPNCVRTNSPDWRKSELNSMQFPDSSFQFRESQMLSAEFTRNRKLEIRNSQLHRRDALWQVAVPSRPVRCWKI